MTSDVEPPAATGPVDRQAAESWALSLLTAAHYGLDEYIQLSQSPPPGGVASLAAIACASMQECADTKGVSADKLLRDFAAGIHAANALGF